MRMEMDIRGFRAARALLKKLPVEVERRIIYAASRQAMEPMRDRAKANLAANGSVRTGELYDSISIRSKKSRDGTLSTRIGPNAKAKTEISSGGVSRTHRPSAIAHLIERGTKPHTIKSKTGLLKLPDGKWLKQVDHPGTHARPFMEPAYDAEKDNAMRTYIRELGVRIKRWIERNRSV